MITTFTRILFVLVVSLTITSCNNPESLKSGSGASDTVGTAKELPVVDTALKVIAPQVPLSVIVLPSYDEIANAGGSPDVAQAIEYTFNADSSFRVIPFPYKTLSNYHMIYDKKYCDEIIQKVNPDVIVMSKLDIVSRVGHRYKDTWNIEAKAYLPNSDTTLTIYSASNIKVWALIEKDIFVKVDREKIKSFIENTGR